MKEALAAPVPAAQPDAASQLAGFVFAVLLLDPEGRVVEANPAAEDLLGRSAQRLVGARFGDVAGFVATHTLLLAIVYVPMFAGIYGLVTAA